MKLHELEALAAEILEEQQTATEELTRMIRAFARIINAKSPDAFSRRATIYADEDGHWDGSYPPKIQFKAHTGPRSINIISLDFTYRATSGGFYHDSEYFTRDGGLYVTPQGSFLCGDLTGTGSFGQFAAHPGECGVDCTVEWNYLDPEDIPLDRLAKAEKELRALAFPLVAAREAQAK